jgi:hypothetical protein
MPREETATVLPFRDSLLRRPIDVVAWMNLHVERAGDSSGVLDNVVPLARVARGRDGGPWFGGPEGEAA